MEKATERFGCLRRDDQTQSEKRQCDLTEEQDPGSLLVHILAIEIPIDPIIEDTAEEKQENK